MTAEPARRGLCVAVLASFGAAPGGIDVASAAGSAEGLLAVATDDVYHGLSQSQGDASALLDGHVRGEGNEFLGVSLASVRLDPYAGTSAEVSVYAGAALEVGAEWTLRGTLVHSAYPGNRSDLSYDYSELLASADWRDRWTATLALSPDTSQYSNGPVNVHRPAQSLELGTRWPLSSAWTLSAGVGYRHLASPIDATYGYGSLTATWRSGAWQADLTLIGTDLRARRLFGPDLAERRAVLGLLRRFGGGALR